MTHLKKSLALLLAFVMIFSSMSVAASAWSATDPGTGFDLGFTVKFFRQDAESGEWIETKNAEPGEVVKARIFVSTDFFTRGGETALLFDSRFFTATGFAGGLVDGVSTSLTTNSGYMNGALGLISDSAAWFSDETNFQQNKKTAAFPNGILVDNGFIPADYFDDYDIISNGIRFGTTSIPNTKLTDDDWILEYNLKVLDDDYTRTVYEADGTERKGTARIPEELRENPDWNEFEMFISFEKGQEGDNGRDMTHGMYSWKANVTSVPGVLKTSSDVILDANEGFYKVEDEYYNTSSITGIIGDKVEGLMSADAQPSRDGYAFGGWAEIPVNAGKPLTDTILSELGYSKLTDAQISAIGWKLTPAMISALGLSQDEIDAVKGELTEEYVAKLGLSGLDAAALNALGCTVTEEMIVGNEDKLSEEEVAAGTKVFEGIILTTSELADLAHGYNGYTKGEEKEEKTTLYATWTKLAAGETYYTYKQYDMNADGTYPSEPTHEEQIKAVAGSEISITNVQKEGYTLDTAKSDDVIIVDSDNSSVLRAYYARNKYTLNYHFEDMAGSQVESESVYYDAVLPSFNALPNGPIKTGHTFTGWATESGESAPATMPAANVDLYPQFEINQYIYVFDALQGGSFADGNRTKSVAYKYGDTPEEFTEIPTMPGKEFDSWSDDMPATVTGDMTFEAVYSDCMYTVTFMNGNEVVDEYPAYYGDEITDDDIPEGYNSKDSWSIINADGSSTVVTFPYTVTGDVVFNAIEDVANVHDAIFYVDGEVYEIVPTIYGEEIVPPEKPSKAGYDFVMWNPEVPYDPDESSRPVMGDQDMEFHAVFELKDVTITFDTDGGSAINPITQKYTTAVKAPANPTKTGYVFAGWTPTIPPTMPANDITVKALWTPDTFKVEYKDTDGTLIDTKTFKYGDTIVNIDDPTKEGHEFVAWTGLPDDMKMPANDVVATATWTVNNYKVTWVVDNESTEETYAYGAEIKKPADPKKEGHTFTGWSPAVDKTMPAKDMTYTATWDKNTHTATFDAAGGIFDDGKSSYSVDVAYGDAITAPANPTKENYIFDGWTPSVPQAMPDGDQNFVATWIPDPSGSVEYTINIVTINPATGEEITTNDPVKGTAKDGETVEVVLKGAESDADHVYYYEDLIDSVSNVPDTDKGEKPYMTVKLGENNTITVYYELKTVTATFVANGGEFADGSDTVTVTDKYGTELTAPAYPTRTGYTCTGWDKTVPSSLTEDATYTAQWKIQKHYAIFNINGKEYAKVEYSYGQEIEAPDYKAETGENFSGWNIPEGTTMGTKDIVFDATSEMFEYKLSYRYNNAPNGAELPAEVKGLNYNSPVEVEAADEIDGYEFDGWYYGNDSYKAGETFTMPNSDAVLVGSYTAKEYTVTYETGFDDITIDPVKTATDAAVALPELSKDGYTFLGWEYDGVTYGIGKTFNMPAKDITVEAIWETNAPETYTLSFNENGGSEVADQQLEEGATIYLPATSKDGYEFLGWEYDGKTYKAGEEFTMPAEGAELTAQWKENEVEPTKYDLTFNENGGSEVADQQLIAGATIYLPATSKDGHEFLGWEYEGKTYKAGEEFTMPAEGAELTAQWKEIEVEPTKYTLTLDANNGAFADTKTTYTAQFEEGQTVVTPGNPSRSGYEFIGWVDANGDAATLPPTMPAKDISLKANWAELHTVTYTVDGEEYEVVADKAKAGDPVPAPTKGNPSKDGFVFKGWVDENGNAVTVMPEGDITLKADWEAEEVEKFTLSYYDGSTLLTSVQYAEGDDIAAYTPDDKEGYTFTGWTDMPADGKMPAKDLVVHAEWDINKNDITLDANGGEFADGLSQFTESDVPYGEKLSGIVPNQPTKEGYTFNGWLTKDGKPAEIPATMPDEEIDLVADWKIKETTITFDANGGEFADGSSTATATGDYGSGIKLPAEPTREGFIFKGWDNLPADGKMPAEDMKVTAKWEAVVETYTLTINANGGTIDGQAQLTKELAEGEEIGTLSTPVKDGYTFKGWNNMPADGKMPAADLEITAKWEANAVPTHTVTYYLVKGEDGVAEPYATETFEEGETMNHPTVSVEGFTFKGWTDENKNPLPATMEDKDIAAYAYLEINTYKVTYLVEEGGAVHAEFTDVKFASEVPKPETEPTKEGYLFAGWSPAVDATMPAKDVVYTATWEKAPEVGSEKYVAKYIVDDSTYALYVLEKGDAIPVPTAPAKFGFKFAGWEPEVPATMPGQDVEFVAQWEIDKTFVAVVIGGTVVSGAVIATALGVNAAIITGVSIIGGIIVIVGVAELVKHTHTVTYIVDGEVYKTYKVVEGTKIPVPADPEKDGAEFKGWNPDVPEKMGSEDLVFEATWDDINIEIPDTGSAAGIAAFAAISGAAAAAYVITKRKKEEN